MQYDGESMLSVNKVYFKYGNNEILNDVSLHINSGEIVGLIGDNGAGKSTLMKVMCGLRQPERGSVMSDCERIGALIEEPAVYGKMSVEKNIRFFERLYGATEKQSNEIMQLTGLNRFPKVKANKLSVGMKKRLGLAIALLSSEKVVLLDEPTSGLDPSGIRDILGLIRKMAKEKKIAFLISSHIFQDLETVCDTYYRLKDTKLTNVYDNSEVFGYKIEKDGMTAIQISEYLNSCNCENIIDNKNVYVKRESLTDKVIEKLKLQNMEWKRRKLSEVYFE